MATIERLDEYGRSSSLLPNTIPRPIRTASGRPALALVKMVEAVLTDTRMGRGKARAAT